MNFLSKSLLLPAFLIMLSASALANKCPCVEYRTDVTCGGCGQSTCATVCLSSVGSGQAAGWDQLFSGFSLKQHSGKLVVAEVLPASPAVDGGVRVGDEVVAIDGMRVPLCRNQATVWQRAPAEHSLVVRRGGKSLALQVSAIRLSALLRSSVAPQLKNVSMADSVADLPPWSPFLSGLVLSSTNKGVVVISVLPGSSADENGIRAGDLILPPSGMVLTDVHQFEGADYRADLTVQVARPSGERTVRLRMNSVTEILSVQPRKRTGSRSASKGL